MGSRRQKWDIFVKPTMNSPGGRRAPIEYLLPDHWLAKAGVRIAIRKGGPSGKKRTAQSVISDLKKVEHFRKFAKTRKKWWRSAFGNVWAYCQHLKSEHWEPNRIIHTVGLIA